MVGPTEWTAIRQQRHNPEHQVNKDRLFYCTFHNTVFAACGPGNTDIHILLGGGAHGEGGLAASSFASFETDKNIGFLSRRQGKCFFCPVPPHFLVDFVVLPPEHGRSVTDFWVWDTHEGQLRCPDDASGDRGRYSARRALKPKFY